ncbi:MAG: hypothetical protein CVU56_10820 [Deltaproteobacteria bacterium HGW-Deltaproteobacteria-14]|nr:MAG: hypothetical protein CVU56_10820 [Deltaproteobacteria bacterium HGW-Deltaproteobacteria-14]
MDATRKLVLVKLIHTVAWAFFAGCVVALPVAALAGQLRLAAWLAGAVMVEIIILALNRMKCPLTAVAARYTDDRRANFDIYLPLWLARYNKEIFGTLFVAGGLIALWAALTAG